MNVFKIMYTLSNDTDTIHRDTIQTHLDDAVAVAAEYQKQVLAEFVAPAATPRFVAFSILMDGVQ